MGHALNGSIQDALIRHARMQGRNTKWILGTDHAGIATQTQVERALKAEGTSKEELGREAFLERMWEWRDQYGGTIISQYRRLGASVDYEDERFTLDDRYVRAVLKVFVDLYEKGLIYRDNYMVNWDPGSALGDLRPGGRGARGRPTRSTAIDYPLEGCERLGHDRHRAARRRCSPTPRSRSTPTTTATRGWWGRRRSCRSSGGG